MLRRDRTSAVDAPRAGGGEAMCTASHGSEDGASVSAAVPDAGGGAAGTADPELVKELAIANRILFQQGVLDAFGHVSVGHDKHPDRFLLGRIMARGLVT